MDTSDWLKIKEVFNHALELAEDERGVFLANQENSVRLEVGRLLQSHEKLDDFISEPLSFKVESNVDSYIGKELGNYKLLGLIGTGGMGQVFLAEKEGLDKKFAIKLIKRGMDTEAVLKRFTREHQILSRLEHPNIAQIIDVGSTDDGLPFFVMENIVGVTITKFCDDHQLNTNERLELFQKVCEAVKYAHQNLVIHRDIKPSNILITPEGTPKLLDFGVAKLLSSEVDDKATTGMQSRMFTPEYASPEQINGSSMTTATDVYSLGVVLYELLSGVRPFNTGGKSYQEIINLVLTEDPMRPSAIGQRSKVKDQSSEKQTLNNNVQNTKGDENQTIRRSQIPNPKSLRGDLDNIILKSLRKEPERRYQTVQEFSEDIRRFLVGLPVTATADTTFYRFTKFVGRNKAGTAVACLVLLLSGFSIWQAILANHERARAEQRFQDVRKLANSIVFEFHDSIEKLPGSTPTRELLLSRALEYLDKLSSESKQDLSLQMELADSYEKIASIQGGYATNHLGNRQKAEESYQKALQIREHLVADTPQNTEYQLKLASSYTEISNMFWVKVMPEESLKMCKKALEIYQKVSEKDPENLEFRRKLANSYSRVGFLLGANNKTEESIESTKKAIEVLEQLVSLQPDTLVFQDTLVGAYDNYATIFDKLKQDYAESFKYYQKNLIISQKLIAAEPDNLKFRRGLGICYFNLADISEKMGDYSTGLGNAEKSLEIFSRLLAEDPKNEDFKQVLAAVDTMVSLLLVKNGKADEAIKKLKPSLEILEKLLKDSPNDEIVHYRIAITEETLGLGYIVLASDKRNTNSLGNWKTAREHFQRSYTIFKKFRDEGKTVGTDASVVDKVADEIAKCDEAIAKLIGK